MVSQKINVLVLPELFPKDDKDWVGVFVVDYLFAIQPYSNLWVFYSRLLGNNQNVKKELFKANFEVYRWSLKKSTSNWLKPIYYLKWFNETVRQVLAQNRTIDIIHSHGTILNGTVAYLLSKKLNVPFVITEHTGPFSKISNSFIKRFWAKFIFNKAEMVFAVSNHLKNEILQIGVDANQVKVTFNPVDTDLFIIDSKRKFNRNMLFVSRLEPFKGGLRTIRAFHQFTIENDDWTLTLCGDGSEKQAILNYVNDNNLQHRVILKGVLSKSEYQKELNHSDFLVFPSLHESFGLIPVEAMASGLPVITTDSTAMPEYINIENGILLKSNLDEELRNAMLRMVCTISDYDPIAIRKVIVERFGIDKFGKEMVTNYQSAIVNYKR